MNERPNEITEANAGRPRPLRTRTPWPTISIYYRSHRDDGDSNVLRHITSFAATNAALSNALYRKME